MSGGPAESGGSPTVRPKAKRLSRSFRQSQPAEVDPPRGQQPDFKTPTRISRSRPVEVSSEESPNADSDCQQDIVWDATSPSPRRRGKRGKKVAAGVVNISEIVNRIAPKHGRPTAAEPTLQQWIGDSATIPCTPDLQVPKPKKKSPRPNAVEGLLKLAKQFDFSMIHQQSHELLSEDIWDFHNSIHHRLSPPRNPETNGTDGQLEDDLNFLFDGPTQHLNRNLSQPTQIRPAAGPRPAVGSEPAAGPKPAEGSELAGKPSSGEFEDDWENDDLLNDSLVLEMTQNPEKFAAPMYSSTQKPANQVSCWGRERSVASITQAGGSNVGKENMRPRTSFRPDPDFCVRRISTLLRPSRQPVVNTETEDERRTSAQRSAGSRLDQRTSAGGFPSAASSSTQRFPPPEGHPPAAPDCLFEDLDSLFSSEPVWDDPADDDLLCEVCDNLEQQIQSATNRPNSAIGLNGGVLRPTGRAQQPLSIASSGTAPLTVCSGAATVHLNTAMCPQANDRLQAPAATMAMVPKKDRFTFKKPNNPVSMVTNKAAGKCSAAEIELKKQQAMERRRQRLNATQTLRPLTQQGWDPAYRTRAENRYRT